MPDLKIALYRNKSSKIPAAQLALDELVAAMHAGNHGGRLDFTKPKSQLPVAAFAAVFKPDAKSKVESEVESASGFIPLDADDLGSPESAQEYFQQIVADSHTALAFISPSGAGVKALAWARPEDLKDNYRTAWREVAEHYAEITGLPIISPRAAELAAAEAGQPAGSKVPHLDSTGDNLNRLAFICQRETVYFNPDPTPFEWTIPEQIAQPAREKTRQPAPESQDNGIQQTVHPKSGDRDLARQALQHVPAPTDGDGCYETLRNLTWAGRDAGLDLTDLEYWAGNYHRAGEIPQIWNDYRPGRITAGTLYHLARQSGWNGKTPRSAQPEPVLLEIDPAAAGTRSDWHEVGQWLAGSTPDYRYDSERAEWARWTAGTHWRFAEGKSKSTPVALEDRLRSIPILEYTEERLNSQLEKGIIAGLRRALDRPFPNYTADQNARAYRQSHIAVPAGVVDLTTGEMEPHDPAHHDTRAVTNGDYRPGDLAGLEELLQERLDPVFDPPEYSQWKSMLGLMLSGRAQSHRPILVFQGPSGSGKGGTLKLMTLSLGQRAKTLKSRFLEETHNEIDADRYWLMCDQPLLLAFDELSADSKIDLGKMLSLTGDNVLAGARLPYQKVPLEDSIPSMIVLAMVEAPRIRRGTGIDRRIFALPFKKMIGEKDQDPKTYYSQDLLDAVTTVGINAAMAVYRPGYRAPQPGAAAQQNLLDGLDDLSAWIDGLDESWNGRPVKDALAAYERETGNEKVTQNLLTRRIQNTEHWAVKIEMIDGERDRRMTRKK